MRRRLKYTTCVTRTYKVFCDIHIFVSQNKKGWYFSPQKEKSEIMKKIISWNGRKRNKEIDTMNIKNVHRIKKITKNLEIRPEKLETFWTTKNRNKNFLNFFKKFVFFTWKRIIQVRFRWTSICSDHQIWIIHY